MNRALGLFSAAVVIATGLSFPLIAQENVYVGSERCRACHAKAYEIWINSGHARAQDHLPENRRAELRCLFCHATDAQTYMTGYKLENVQCEACHGPGSKHIAAALKDNPKDKAQLGLEPANEQKCRLCHNDIRSPNLRPFAYDAALQKIRHW